MVIADETIIKDLKAIEEQRNKFKASNNGIIARQQYFYSSDQSNRPKRDFSRQQRFANSMTDRDSEMALPKNKDNIANFLT